VESNRFPLKGLRDSVSDSEMRVNRARAREAQKSDRWHSVYVNARRVVEEES